MENFIEQKENTIMCVCVCVGGKKGIRGRWTHHRHNSYLTHKVGGATEVADVKKIPTEASRKKTTNRSRQHQIA